MAEIWRPVVGLENVYSVSSHGRVRREAAAQGAQRGRILTLLKDRKGYAIVNLQSGGQRFRSKVHRLVAAAFYGNEPDSVVRHIDDDPWNNRVENLAWGTHAENSADRKMAGPWKNHNTFKTHCKWGHEFSSENTHLWVDKRGKRHRRCRTCRRQWQRLNR